MQESYHLKVFDFDREFLNIVHSDILVPGYAAPSRKSCSSIFFPEGNSILYRIIHSPASFLTHSFAIHQARNFYTGISHQIINKPFFEYISGNFIRISCHNSLHNTGCVLAGTLMRDISAIQDLSLFFLPDFYNFTTALRRCVKRDLEPTDQLRITVFYIKWIVFRIMFAGFCAIIPQFVYIIKPHHVVMFFFFARSLISGYRSFPSLSRISKSQAILDDIRERKGSGENPDLELTTIAGMPQLRMIRCIEGEYCLKETENEVCFPDSIGMTGDWRKSGMRYEIPYRALYNSVIKISQVSTDSARLS